MQQGKRSCVEDGRMKILHAHHVAPHHSPHFHAYYQNHVAIYLIDTVDLISGSLPRKQQRLVEAWAELHQGELMENWERLQSGQFPYKITPLK